jgi:hypothetical protein
MTTIIVISLGTGKARRFASALADMIPRRGQVDGQLGRYRAELADIDPVRADRWNQRRNAIGHLGLLDAPTPFLRPVARHYRT